jgi:hypothetical protein
MSARILLVLLEIVSRGQQHGELRADLAAPVESMALLVMAAYFYAFFAWLEQEYPPELNLLLHIQLDLLQQGMQSH